MAQINHKVKEVSDTLFSMGHKLNDKFDSTDDVRVALAAIAAFNVGIKAQQTQLTYKKMTGTPMKINFLED
jgi:hypothetical protein